MDSTGIDAGSPDSTGLSVGVDGAVDVGRLGGNVFEDSNNGNGKGKGKDKDGDDARSCEDHGKSNENNGKKNGKNNGKKNGNANKVRDGGKCKDRPGENRGGPTVQVGVDRVPGPPGMSAEFRRLLGERKDDGNEGRKRGRTSKVNVTVSGVHEGETVSLNVSTEETEDDEVAFDSITAEVEKGGNFTMAITASRDPLPGSPEFTPDDGSDPIDRIRLDHSISNDDVDNVSFTFRMSKERLRATDTDLEEVALYRYADETWTALPTRPVAETETHYVFSVESPGMSEFAVGSRQPEFDLWHADVNAHSVTVGESVDIRGRVTNVGGADGVYTAELVVDGRTVERRQLTIASGGTRQATFRWTFDRPGEHEVMINDVSAGTVTVRSADETSGQAASLISDSLFGWVDGMGIASTIEWVVGSDRVVTPVLVPIPVSASIG